VNPAAPDAGSGAIHPHHELPVHSQSPAATVSPGEKTRLIACALVALLFCTVLVDPYGWHWWESYDVGIGVWWKPAIGVLDLLLLAFVAKAVTRRRWRRAARLSAAECAFAIVAGLFIAHGDLIRNAADIAWLPGLRVLLAAYVATLGLRVVLAWMLYRAARQATAGSAAA
jgi:hypothetical protein